MSCSAALCTEPQLLHSLLFPPKSPLTQKSGQSNSTTKTGTGTCRSSEGASGRSRCQWQEQAACYRAEGAEKNNIQTNFIAPRLDKGLLGASEERKPAASFHCEGCTHTVRPVRTPPPPIPSPRGVGAAGPDLTSTSTDCQAPGREETGAARAEPASTHSLDGQLKKCLEWHFPAWRPTQLGSNTGCETNTEEIT